MARTAHQRIHVDIRPDNSMRWGLFATTVGVAAKVEMEVVVMAAA